MVYAKIDEPALTILLVFLMLLLMPELMYPMPTCA